MPGNELNPPLPRSVLVAENGFYLGLSQGNNSVELLDDPEALVIPFSITPVAHEKLVITVRNILRDAGQLTSGALLIRNPYEEAAYEFAESAIETFAIAKYHALANVARLLGAREVHFEDAKAETVVNTRTGGLKAHIPWGDGKVDFSKVVKKNLKNRLEGTLKFAGGSPATDEALAYLSKRNLLQDQQLRALIDMRIGDNLVSEYKMTLNGTHEADSNVNCALRIANAGPIKAVKIGGSFAAQAHSIRTIDITTTINF